MSSTTVTKDSITSFLRKKTTGPVSFRDIALSLKLSPSEKRKMKRALRELTEEGSVIRTRKGLYGPAEEMSLVTGYFEAHRDGYGFVIPDKTGERDVFIPARATLGAMDNDRVVARIESRHRREGRIIRILERTHTRIAGTLDVSRRGFYVRPKSRSIQFDLYIKPDDIGDAKDGDRVVAEITNYPDDKRPPTGRIIRILKKPESPLDEIEGIIEELDLPGKFQRKVIEEAKALYEKTLDSEHEKRKDLRKLHTVTIDGERAKDFDDAVSIKKTDGGYRLWVHIADVGHYVPWDSLLDKEARKRGTSVYFPDRVIPMLPKELSEDLCSLKPKVDRPAFTVEMDFDEDGSKNSARFYPSIINSDERMTYSSVKAILIDKDPDERTKYDYLLNDFELMSELCNLIKKQRMLRGSLDFDLPEPEVLLDIQGNPEAIISAERNFAHMIIEEFMISANEAVAEHMEDLNIPCLYRIHEEPDPIKLDSIMKTINSLGVFKNRKGAMPEDFSGLLTLIQGIPGEDVINHMILRSLKQAKYSPVNIGHFGLASESYTHFTSPIRRYPDLVVHRVLREVILRKNISDDRISSLEAVLTDIASHSSLMERRSDDAERSVLNAMRVWFMKDKVGEEFDGKVVAVTPYGLKIRLRDYYVEGFLHVSYMTDDYYLFDEKNIVLYGRNRKKSYTIGSALKVRIDRVDMEEKEITLGA